MSEPSVLIIGNKLSAMALALRRLVLLDRARTALGGAARLAVVMGIGRRAVNYKLSADRGLSDAEIAMVADGLDRHAATIVALARDLRAIVQAEDGAC